jgi:Flp pilus assembly protein TadD
MFTKSLFHVPRHNARVSRRTRSRSKHEPQAKRKASIAAGREEPPDSSINAAGLERPAYTTLLLPALVLVVLVAYYPAWRGGQLWDDDAHITSVELQSADGLRRIWFELGATQQYYPVVHSSFWILHKLWGDTTLGYHIVNIVLHALSAFLVVVILRRLAVPGAVLAGVLFALHPVHVESVAWMTELKNTLSGVFYLTAALVYLEFDRGGRRVWYALAFVLFCLALLSKSVTATLPAVLLVVFWWQRGRLSWKQAVPLAPFFITGVAAGLFTAWVERTFIGARGAEFHLSLLDRLLIAGRAPWFYLAKLIWPANLIFVYPRWQIDPAVWWLYLYPIGLVAAGVLLWRFRTTSRAPLAACLMFCGTLVPALGFVNVFPFRYSFVADHFQYLASIPMLALAAAGVAILVSRVAGAARHTQVLALVVLILGAGLGTLTWRQSRQYISAEVLYRETIARNPAAWMAYNNLGALKATGTSKDLAEAATLLQTAVRLYPENPEAHNNLGVAYQRLGRLDDATREHREALRLFPTYAEAYNNLGIIAEQQGRLEEAISDYTSALRFQRRDKDRAEAHHNMGSALQKLGRDEEAVTEIREALRINPRYADAHDNLGSALMRLGRTDEAIAQYTEAIRLKPDYAEAHNNLGRTLLQAGRAEGAIAEFNETIRLKPDAALPHVNLADVLRRLGRRDEAISHLQTAIRLQPDLAFAHYSLGNLLHEKGQFADAIAEYREALRYEPEATSYAVHNDLGVALAQLGRRQEALAEFERALQIKPDFADAKANKARAGK